MRFMIIVKSTPRFEARAGTGLRPEPAVFAEMAAYHEELGRAGVVLDANGLRPGQRGWFVRHDRGRRSIVDDPFTEAGERIAGYTLIQVPSREEAEEWVRCFPNPAGRASRRRSSCGSGSNSTTSRLLAKLIASASWHRQGEFARAVEFG